MLLLTLLPLAGWAQPSGVATEPKLASSPITWDGNAHQLVTIAGTTVSDYHSSWTGGSWHSGSNIMTGWHDDDPAGIQYYVRTGSDPAPQNGYSGDGTIWGTAIYPTWYYGTHGITYDATSLTQSAVGTYQVYYRVMRDRAVQAGDYQTSNWQSLGTVEIEKPAISDMPYYVNGPQRVTGLVYNDADQELITAGTDFCANYVQSGVLYVVKTEHAMPTAAEEAAATTSIPTGKNAGTYYVYYKILKDGVYYTNDGMWTEVGVGGINIEKRPITADDFAVTYAEDLTFTGNAQNFVTDLTWTGGIDRTATRPAPDNGKVEYIVQYEEETPAIVAAAEGTHAGAYKVAVKISGDANHKDFTTEPKDLTIKKATYTVKEPTIGTFTYDGTKQGPLATPDDVVVLSLSGAPGSPWYASSGRIEYSITKTATSWVTNPNNETLKRTNAGTYKIAYRTKDIPENADFEPVEGELEFTIDKADWVPVEPALTPDWDYDGAEHALLAGEVTAPGAQTTDVAEVEYYINDGEAIAFADVKAMNVGTYEVWYSIKEAANYNAFAKKSLGTVTVSKIKLHMGAQGQNVPYGTTVSYYDLIQLDAAELAGKESMTIEELKDALVKFVSFDGGTIEAGKPTKLPTDVGAWNFTLAPQEGNYELVNFIPDGTLTITAIDPTPATVVAATLEYDGTDQELLEVTGTVDGGETLYFLGDAAPVVPASLESVGEWSKEIPVATPAGTYKVWYMTKGDKNHNDIAPASVDVTIEQKPLDIAMFTFSDDDMKAVFTGENLMPTFEAVAGEPIADTDYTVATTLGSETVTEMVNVGIYTFTFTAAADGNYKSEVSATFEITPKSIEEAEFALETTTVPYDGEDHKADVKVNPTAPLTADDFEVVLPTDMVDAAEYTITLNGKGNYMSTATATFTITQAENLATVEIEGWTYGETANVPVADATFKAADEPTITYAKKGETTFTADVPVNAGDYTVKASVEETTNWAAAEATADFTIAKAASEVTPPTFKKNLTYNGVEQALLTAAAVVPEDGKVTYAVNGGEESEDIPVAKNVGTYTITTTYTPDDNHLPATIEDITVEIHPVVLTFALANVEKTWDGEKLTAEQVDKLSGSMYGELQAEDEYEPPFTLSLPEDVADVTDAGTYNFTQMNVTWEEEGVENYNIKFSGTGLIQINKADLVEGTDFTAPTAVPDLVYNGEPQAVVTSGEMINDYGTILFSVAKDGEYGEEFEKPTEAGDYEIWWYVQGDKNHNDTEPVKIENSIAPKAWTAVLAAFGEETAIEKTYTGEPVLTEAELVLFDDKTELGKDVDYTLTIAPEGLTNVGEYTLTYKGIGNYADASNVAEYTVSIKQAEITAEAPKAIEGLKYTAAEQTLITAGGTPSFGTMVYSLDGETYAEALPVGKNAGTYTVWYKVDGDDNHAALAPASIDVEIAKLPVIVTAPDATKEFNGIAGLEGAEVGEFVYNGVLAGDAIELAGDITDYLTVKDAKAEKGTYAIQVVEDAFNDASENYEITATIDGKLTITAAAGEVTVNVAEGFKFTKVYGDAGVVAVPELVVEGAVAEDVDAIKAGVELKKNDYDENVGLQKGAYSLVAKKDAAVFNNYANVTFGTVDMEITKAPLIVSIKAQEKTYDGKPAEIEINDETIGDMIAVEGLKFDDTAAILSGNLTATVGDGNAVAAGEYNIALEGEVDNYEITPILGTYTINKAVVTATLKAQKVQKGKELDETAFADATGIAEGDEDYFYVTAEGLVDMDGVVTGEAGVYADALTLAVDDEVADNYEIEATPAELEIIAADAIILADNEDWTTEAKENVTVTFADRSINAGFWNVVALPFEASVKEISDAFGYAAVDVLNETASDGSIHFQVISSGTVPAYTPFIIKTTEDKDLAKNNFNEVTFHNVNIEAWPEAKNSVKKDAANNEFIGTFMANTEIPAGSKEYWYMSKGTWYDTSARSKAINLKAFRAYVHFDPANVAAGARIYIEEPDGTETAIDAIEFSNMVNGENTYTVGGMKVSNTAQKGVYIKNGKKVAVK